MLKRAWPGEDTAPGTARFMDLLLLYLIIVAFVATLIRSAFGFGEALIAVPLLALVMPVQEAAPLAVLLSITVAAIVIVQDWRDVHVRSASLLLAATALGTPLGLLLLVAAPPALVQMLLAIIIIAFSLHHLFARRRAHLRSDRHAWAFGLTAGVLGGAYGMNGPPLVLYATLRRWSPQHFRATLQGYFLPASIIAMAGYYLAGLWTSAVSRAYLACLPATIVAVLLGRLINRRLQPSAFLTAVHLGLVLIAIVLIWQAVLKAMQSGG